MKIKDDIEFLNEIVSERVEKEIQKAHITQFIFALY